MKVEDPKSKTPMSYEEAMDLLTDENVQVLLEKGDKVLVEVYMPHLKQYGYEPSRSLVYRWIGGSLAVGDLVICPGSNQHASTFTGIVISLDASGNTYRGPVKYLLGKANPEEIEE